MFSPPENFIKEGLTNFASSTLFGSLGPIAKPLINKVTNIFSEGFDYITGNTQNASSSIGVSSIKQFATGGKPQTGQLFIANEAGPELVGNIGNGGTSVANNNMILESMRKAVYEATHNALVDVFNQTKSIRTSETHFHINENGLSVFDDSTLRQLARVLAPHINGNNVNIADISFSL